MRLAISCCTPKFQRWSVPEIGIERQRVPADAADGGAERHAKEEVAVVRFGTALVVAFTVSLMLNGRKLKFSRPLVPSAS